MWVGQTFKSGLNAADVENWRKKTHEGMRTVSSNFAAFLLDCIQPHVVISQHHRLQS